MAMAPGFEPGTVCLEGRCSIQLSYATNKGHTLAKRPMNFNESLASANESSTHSYVIENP